MFDLVIQGPLNNTSLQYVDKYHSQFKNIIVSHWEEDLTDSVKSNYNKLSDQKIVKGDYGGQYKPLAQITSQPLPDISKLFFFRNDSNFFYSIASTYEGLKQCTSPYVVKMRSDECYLNLNPLKEKFLKDTKKMVCGNIFFKTWEFRPYHIGDHLFVAEREALFKTYDNLLNFFRYGSPKDKPWASFTYEDNIAPEQVLARSYLTSKNCPISDWDNKETLFKHFDVIDVNQLSPYVSRWVHADQTYSSDGVRFSGEVSNVEDV
jgi:hypothetical protein